MSYDNYMGHYIVESLFISFAHALVPDSRDSVYGVRGPAPRWTYMRDYSHDQRIHGDNNPNRGEHKPYAVLSVMYDKLSRH